MSDVPNVPIIVTRAEPGASETAARLEAAGHAVIKAPMLRIEAIAPVPALPDASDLVFTSANGVTAFADSFSERAFAAWCVGPATSAAARKAGFESVHESAGGVDELAALILAAPMAPTQRFLHVANEAAAGALVQQLRAGGRAAEFAALYRTVAVPDLPPAVHAALQAETAIVLFHSAKGASAFLAAVGATPLQKVIAVSISKAAAAPLTGCGLRAALVAAAPHEAALMTALDTALLTLCKRAPTMPESKAS